MSLALVGIALNATAILVNGGFMPVWEPSLTAAGFGRADVLSPIHVILPATLDANFFRSAGPLGDVIPVPLPCLRNVLSIGDVILGAGLAFFLFAGLVRRPDETWPDGRHDPWRRTEPAGDPGRAGGSTCRAGSAREPASRRAWSASRRWSGRWSWAARARAWHPRRRCRRAA